MLQNKGSENIAKRMEQLSQYILKHIEYKKEYMNTISTFFLQFELTMQNIYNALTEEVLKIMRKPLIQK